MATCGGCWGEKGKANKRSVTFLGRHLADVDCTACNVQSNTSCNSCHFDSELEGRKRFYRQTPPSGFRFLTNFKDVGNQMIARVRIATYQSLTVGAACVDGFAAPRERRPSSSSRPTPSMR